MRKANRPVICLTCRHAYRLDRKGRRLLCLVSGEVIVPPAGYIECPMYQPTTRHTRKPTLTNQNQTASANRTIPDPTAPANHPAPTRSRKPRHPTPNPTGISICFKPAPQSKPPPSIPFRQTALLQTTAATQTYPYQSGNPSLARPSRRLNPGPSGSAYQSFPCRAGFPHQTGANQTAPALQTTPTPIRQTKSDPAEPTRRARPHLFFPHPPRPRGIGSHGAGGKTVGGETHV